MDKAFFHPVDDQRKTPAVQPGGENRNFFTGDALLSEGRGLAGETEYTDAGGGGGEENGFLQDRRVAGGINDQRGGKLPLRQLFRESQDGLDRVRKIIQSLKDFSRTDAAETWRLDDINQGLESTLCVVWNELKYKCEVRKEYGDLPAIECVMSNLNQVFMNLLVNAAHAIHEQGVVTVRTGCAGDEVWVEIADNGEGIAPENLSHIFDPFFTTRAVGKGSGLGLSISYGIIEKHHGRIEVESELGRGTRFRIGLPVRQPGEHLMEGGD